MAKPTGAISTKTVYYNMAEDSYGPDADSPQEMYFIFRAQLIHPDFATSNVPGQYMSHTVDREVEITNSGSYSEYWYIGDSVYGAFADHPHTATASGTLSDSEIAEPKPKTLENGIHYIIAKCKAFSTVAVGDVVVEHITFEAKNDTEYSGDGVEMLKRSGDRLYAPDYPCSAWHVMKALVATQEKMLYESRPCFCVPVFGDAT